MNIESKNTIKRLFCNANFLLLVSVVLTLIVTWLVDRDVNRNISESIKVYLAVTATVLALVWPILNRKAAFIVLSLLTSVAAMNYMRWGPDVLIKKIHPYDVIFYYLGTKYFDEVGYYDLAPAIILADNENGPYSKNVRFYRAQDKVHGYQFKHILHGVAQGKKLREERFSTKRWEMFEQDFLQLQRGYNFSKKLWRQLLEDRGFNATPTWMLFVKPIINLIDVENVKWLCLADLFFIVVGLFFIRWAYGNTAALWGLLFFMLSYSLRWPMIGWAIFRYDWVCALMIALALIKKNHHMMAGAFTGLACVFRLFPVIWLFGPAVKGGLKLIRGKTWESRLDKKLLWLATAFLLTVAVVESGAIIVFGTETVEAHMENMSEHTSSEELSSNRLGFALGLAFDGKLLPHKISNERKQKVKSQTALRLILSIVILGVMAWFLRNKDDDETYAYGYIALFLLATGTYYYAVARITLIVFHASKLHLWKHRVALAILFGLEVFSNWAATAYAQFKVFLIGYLAWGLMIYIVFILWVLYSEQKQLTISKSI